MPIFRVRYQLDPAKKGCETCKFGENTSKEEPCEFCLFNPDLDINEYNLTKLEEK